MTLEGSKPARLWEPMQLTALGNVGDVVQVGMGKLTTPAVDPGEPLKTKPSDP